MLRSFWVLLRMDVNHQVEIIVEVFLCREYFHTHLRTEMPTNVGQMYSRKYLLVQILYSYSLTQE